MHVMQMENTKSSVYNAKEIESSVQERWKKHKVPEMITKMNWKRPKFYIIDGPPYVNGTPHVGHVKTILFKDSTSANISNGNGNYFLITLYFKVSVR